MDGEIPEQIVVEGLIANQVRGRDDAQSAEIVVRIRLFASAQNVLQDLLRTRPATSTSRTCEKSGRSGSASGRGTIVSVSSQPRAGS